MLIQTKYPELHSANHASIMGTRKFMPASQTMGFLGDKVKTPIGHQTFMHRVKSGEYRALLASNGRYYFDQDLINQLTDKLGITQNSTPQQKIARVALELMNAPNSTKTWIDAVIEATTEIGCEFLDAAPIIAKITENIPICEVTTDLRAIAETPQDAR